MANCFYIVKGVLFATSERFTVLVEESTTNGAISGYSIRLILNDVSIVDEICGKTFMHELQKGSPAFDFQGEMQRTDGWTEGLVLRGCIPIGTIDVVALVSGFLDTMAFAVNEVPEQSQKSLGIQL